MICKPVKNNNGPRKEMRLSKRRLCRDMVAFLRPDMGLVGWGQKEVPGGFPPWDFLWQLEKECNRKNHSPGYWPGLWFLSNQYLE
jgi:hypothetical protein